MFDKKLNQYLKFFHLKNGRKKCLTGVANLDTEFVIWSTESYRKR